MRKSNSIKNLLTSITPFFILTILGFFRVNIFLATLGMDIFSLNQVFFQIFAYISLAEGGIGALINQQYYKLLVANDKNSINSLYTSSKKMFNKISLIIFVLGIVLSFFLKFLTNNTLSLTYMQFVFILFLIRAILEFIFFPPRIIMQADQKMYKTNLIYNFYRILEIILEIIGLLLGASYVMILLITILVRIVMYSHINKKVFKEYPWLTTIKSKSTIKIKGIKDIMAIKLAGVAYENTDIILISTFLQPLQVTIYVSYNYIIKFLNDLSYMIHTALLASFGNVLNKENIEYRKNIFEEINIMFLTLGVIFSVITYSSINSFIKLWIGENVLITNLTLYSFIILLFYNITKKPFLIQRDTEGMFKETAKMNIIEAILNIVLSVVLVNKLGITGVLIGSILASLLTNFWYMPVLIYKYYKVSSIKYFWKLSYHLIITLLLCFIGQGIYDIFIITNFLDWGLYTTIFSIVILIIILITQYLLFRDFKSFSKKIIVIILERKKIHEKDFK